MNWADGDPWDSAPIHLSQVMSPSLASVGAYQYTDAHGITWNCLTTWPGYVTGLVLQTKVPRMFSFPGNGARGVSPEMQASESPTVPNGWVGLSTSEGGLVGGTTGPFIYLYWVGPTQHEACTANPRWHVCIHYGDVFAPSPVAAVLRKPDGAPADTRLVTQQVIAKAGYDGYIPADSGMLVPVYPLKPHQAYTVQVTFELSATSSFSCPPPLPGLGIKQDWCLPRYAPLKASMSFTTGS